MRTCDCRNAVRWVVGTLFFALLLTVVVCGIGGGAAQAAAPSHTTEIIGEVMANNGAPAVCAGRVAWIAAKEDATGSAMFVYDSLTQATRIVSTHVGEPDIHDYYAMAGDLLVWIDYSSDPDKIWAANLATGEERLITVLNFDQTGIATDGRYITWNDRPTNSAMADIYLYDWSNGAALKLDDNPAHEYGAVVGGGYVAWMLENPPNPYYSSSVVLYTIGSDKTEVLADDALSASWVNLDQGRVVWQSSYSGMPELVMRDLATGHGAVIESPGLSGFVAFRGNTIAWAIGDEEEREVWVYDVGADESTRVTNDSLSDEWIETDGRWVVWLKYDGQSSAVFAYDTVTHQTIQLSEYSRTSRPLVNRGRLVFSTGPGSGTNVYMVTFPLFDDVLVDHPFFAAVQGLAERDLIAGYPQNEGSVQFRPDNSVLRAQYSKMIDGALGLAVAEDMAPPVEFTDLETDNPKNLYPHEYVWTAYLNQIVYGFKDGTFRPYTDIQRGHVVTMTVRATQRLHPAALVAVPDSFTQTWGLDLLPEHKANARIAQSNGLLESIPIAGVAANGNAPMPRQEVAQVMWNMMKKIAPAFWWGD